MKSQTQNIRIIKININGEEDVSEISGLPNENPSLNLLDKVATGSLEITDKDRTDATFTVASQSQAGEYGDLQFSSDGRSYTYTAREDDLRELSGQENPTDTDTFTVATTDGASVDLSFDLVGNRNPIAEDDSISLSEGESTTINPTENDSDPDNDNLQISIQSNDFNSWLRNEVYKN